MLGKLLIRTACQSNSDEVLWLATMHERAPSAWWPNYRPKESEIQKRYQEFQEKAEDSLFLIAEIGSEPVGYHWIDLERANDTIVAHVKGLGVLDGFRRRGIAAALKLRGEKWCIERNCRVIKTNVHYNNKAMLDWNVRQGFEPGFVELYKPINNAR